MRLPFASACLTVSMLLAACGGGESETPAAVTPFKAPRTSLAAAAPPDASALMDWAQANYPAYFPGVRANQTSAPYTYRYYPETQNYLGVSGANVYVMGSVTGNALVPLGTLADYTCSVYPGSCASPAAPAPGGTYTAYAANGQRFTLALDFDQASYSFAGLTVPAYSSAGVFAAGSSGNYLFQTGSGIANATFRTSDDLVVGSYDFGSGVQPFVAGRRFAATATEASGTYNTLGVSRTTANLGDSTIYSSRIDADGKLRICNDNVVYTLNLCPAASVITYTLAVNDTTFTASAPGRDSFNFRVALAGNEKIYLMASTSSVSGTRYFRIGVLDSPSFASGTAYGATTLGEWGTVSFSNTSYSSTGFAADGHAINLTGTLSSMGTTGPTGMRVFHAAGSAFAIQNTQLAVMVGARNGTGAGYMQIGGK